MSENALGMMYCYWLTMVQIVLESFPVSSSAHIVLLQQCLQLPQTLHEDLFSHFIHAPTVIIVALFFFKQWFFLFKNMRRCWRIIATILFYTGVSDVVTVLFFVLFKRIGADWFPLGLGLAITLCGLYSLRFIQQKKTKSWSLKNALILGGVQGIALLPGISRLGSTYTAARWLGLSPRKAFEISLLVQWPLIFAASVNSIRVLWSEHILSHYATPTMLFVMSISALVAWYGLRLTAYCVRTGREHWFAWYLLFPITIWVWLMTGKS